MAITCRYRLSISCQSVDNVSCQCDDFHRVCFAFGPLLAFEVSLWGRASCRCCRADGERTEVCEGICRGGGMGGWKHGCALPQGCVFSLRLLASPVKAAGCESVMSAEVAPAVGHTQAVARLSRKGHLHCDGALEGQCTRTRLETRGQAWVWREPTPRCDGGRRGEQPHPVALEEVLRHVHHWAQSLGISQGLQLGQGRGMLGKVWVGVPLKEQLWRGGSG